jgi:SPP1 gp7 family putative phage head morphogenesis protein
MLAPCECGKCAKTQDGKTLDAREEKASKAEEAARAALWREHARMREPWAKRFYSRASRIINDARIETLKRLEAQRTKGLEAKGLNEVDVVFDLGEFMKALLGGLGDISQAAMKQALVELALELGSKDPLTLPQDKVLLMARRRGVFLSKTAADIWGEVAEQVREGITKGESIDDLATRLRGKFTMLSKERSTRIALTETTASYEMARQEGFIEAGVEWKEWLSSRDDRVRDAHQAADGQVVAAEAPFMVHGVPMMHPGAYGAPAELVVNCRCLAIAAEEGPKT